MSTNYTDTQQIQIFFNGVENCRGEDVEIIPLNDLVPTTENFLQISDSEDSEDEYLSAEEEIYQNKEEAILSQQAAEEILEHYDYDPELPPPNTNGWGWEYYTEDPEIINESWGLPENEDEQEAEKVWSAHTVAY